MIETAETAGRPLSAVSDHHHEPLGRRRTALAAGMGLLAALLAYQVVASGIMPFWPRVATVPLLLVLVPSARRLAPRVALNGLIFLGWGPLLWSTAWLASTNHAGLLAAIVTGSLVARTVVVRDRPAARRALLPVVVGTDVLLLVGAVAALLVTAPLSTVSTGKDALTALLPGYDNVAHYDIFKMVWTHGVTLDRLGPAPDGTDWAYSSYPQGYHALLATFAQLTVPTGSSLSGALVVFARCVAGLVVLGTVTITAALLSVPRISRRPGVLLPLLTLVLTAFLWQPGGFAIWDGFANFWLAAAFGGGAILLTARTVDSPGLRAVDAAALSGALIGVAMNWFPLLCCCWAAALPVAHRVLRRSGGRVRTWLLAGVLLSAVVAVGRTALVLVRSVGGGALLESGGAIHSAAPLPALLLTVALVGSLIATLRSNRLHIGWPLARVATLGIATGVLACTALAVAQIRSTGSTSYYFVKLFMGFELVLVCAVAGVAGLVLAEGSKPARRLGLPLAVACTVAAFFFFGPVRWADVAQRGTDYPVHDDAGRRLSWSAMSQGILAAAAATPSDAAAEREYVALGPGRGYRANYPAAWYHATTGSMTAASTERGTALIRPLRGPRSAKAAIDAVLRHPGVEVIVDPDRLADVRAAVGHADASRVRAWVSVESE